MSNFSVIELIKSSPELVLIMFVGALVYAIPTALISYFLGLRLILLYRTKKEQRRARQAQKMQEKERSGKNPDDKK